MVFLKENDDRSKVRKNAIRDSNCRCLLIIKQENRLDLKDVAERR